MSSDRPWEKECDECQSMSSDYPCPVNNCTKHSDGKTIHWIHDGCGGSFRIYENGKERCEKCKKELFFCMWSYTCSSDSKSKQISYSKIKNVLQKLVGMDARDISTTALMHIWVSIEHQCKEYPQYFAD